MRPASRAETSLQALAASVLVLGPNPVPGTTQGQVAARATGPVVVGRPAVLGRAVEPAGVAGLVVLGPALALARSRSPPAHGGGGGALGRHAGPFAFALHQGPAPVGLLVVVKFAQPVQQLEHGDVASGPVGAVVGLAVPAAHPAAGHGTGGVEPVQRRALVGVGPPAQVGHAHHLLARGDDGLVEGALGPMMSATTWALTGPKPAISHVSAARA